MPDLRKIKVNVLDTTYFRHRGLTLPQVLFRDPDWFFWAEENQVFKGKPLSAEAVNIASKSRSIKVPADYPDHIVQYIVHRPSGAFQEIRLIERSAHRYKHAIYSDAINLDLPRALREYDKSGGRMLIRSLKFYYFGNESARMSKVRCERFFDDESNFEEEESSFWLE